MAEIKKVKGGVIRLVCDCGEFIHELWKDDNGELQVETMERHSKPEPKPEPKPEAKLPVKQKSNSIFED